MPTSNAGPLRVLLVKPYSRTSYGYPTTPPLGPALLATILRDAGQDVRVMDLRTKGQGEDTFVRMVREFRPQIVGFTVSSFEYLNTVELCRAAKRIDGSIVTIVGGPHATMSPERTLEAAEIDFIGVGEADYALRDFVKAFPDREAMGRVPGIGFRDGRGALLLNREPDRVADLDALPLVDFSLFDLDAYRVRGGLTLPLFTSRGCPYNCIYCVSYKTQGKRYRARSPQSLVDEIERNSARFRTKRFTILDDTFNLDRQRVLDFCSELTKRKLDVQWDCVQGIRADRADYEIFRAMQQAGCLQVAIGVESGDETVLRNINKGETLEQIRSAIEAANRAGLMTKGFFIVGSPGETVETVRRSVRFFKETNLTIPRFSMIMAFPDTQLEAWVRKNGRMLIEPYEYVTRHSELAAAGVQFETDDLPKAERVRMFRYAEREADIWLIRSKLIGKFGRRWGRVLTVLFYPRICREVLKLGFRLNLLDVYS